MMRSLFFIISSHPIASNLIVLEQTEDQRQGYNEAVDWWSLGVTVYKMLTGVRPFDPPPWARKKSVIAMLRRQTEFEKLQAGVSTFSGKRRKGDFNEGWFFFIYFVRCRDRDWLVVDIDEVTCSDVRMS